jgi:hypothetical protein
MFYENVFRTFEKEGLRYLVVGGIAVNLHGVPRSTADLDIMVDLKDKNLKKLIRAMKKLGFIPRAPVNPEDLVNEKTRKKWWRKKKMEVFTFWNPKKSLEEVDVFIKNPIEFESSYNRRKEIKAKNISRPLASIEDIIKIKEKSRRKQDIADIEALKKLMKI